VIDPASGLGQQLPAVVRIKGENISFEYITYFMAVFIRPAGKAALERVARSSAPKPKVR
jgi:hypothetical protein